MSKREVQITDIALCDISAIIEFEKIENKDNSSAKMLARTFEALSSHIKMGIKREDLTDREVMFYCVKKSWLVVYNYDDKNLTILRVLANFADLCQSIY